MKLSKIKELLKEHEVSELAWAGACHDCKSEVEVVATDTDISGGAVYEDEPSGSFFLKCDKCFDTDPVLRNYRPCDVYSRVVGYLSPTTQWNAAKLQEFKARQNYTLPEGETIGQ